MKTLKIKLLTTVAACLLGATATHANLVVNGGFETGDFSGWTLTGNPDYISITTDAHSGDYAASFGAIGSQTFLTQTALISTMPGQSYVFDFWLKNTSSEFPSLFTVSWNGILINSLTDSAATDDYAHFTYSVMATAGSTPIEFGFQHDPRYWRLDDVSVVEAVPEPSTYLAGALLALVFGVQGFRSLRSRKQTA